MDVLFLQPPPAGEAVLGLPPERIIWAFCLMTSAGVRTRHDASSAVPEASECTTGVGRPSPSGKRLDSPE